jgi:hypothetical protein
MKTKYLRSKWSLFKKIEIHSEVPIKKILKVFKYTTCRPWSFKAIKNREKTRSLLFFNNIFVTKPMLFLFNREPIFWIRLSNKNNISKLTVRFINPFMGAAILIFILGLRFVFLLGNNWKEMLIGIFFLLIIDYIISISDSLIFRDWTGTWELKCYSFITELIERRIPVLT